MDSHKIIAEEWGLSNVTDAKVLPNLLKQTRWKIAEISGDGAYHTNGCYESIRIKRAIALIPLRDGVVFWQAIPKPWRGLPEIVWLK